MTSLPAQDDSILAGYVGTDEAVQASGAQPTVAVFSPYEKSEFVRDTPADDVELANGPRLLRVTLSRSGKVGKRSRGP
ncbi:hypothetical protein FAIPA1_360057 [Frankia sp. AiPs1]